MNEFAKSDLTASLVWQRQVEVVRARHVNTVNPRRGRKYNFNIVGGVDIAGGGHDSRPQSGFDIVPDNTEIGVQTLDIYALSRALLIFTPPRAAHGVQHVLRPVVGLKTT